MEMDTDSAYMALSGPLESLIRPEMKEVYYTEYGNWFPRLACSDHVTECLQTQLRGETWVQRECCKRITKYDKRTPGLFKDEFRGNGMIALNSKTYYCWKNDDEYKMSSKGLSKRTNNLDKCKYLGVLRSRKACVGMNRGFQLKKNKMVTYEQLKTGLSYFYGKRHVHSDGVSTFNTHL